jgi:hypothetical protein
MRYLVVQTLLLLHFAHRILCTHAWKSKQACYHVKCNNVRILNTIRCDFDSVWDIATFKRHLYSTLHAECSACLFLRPYKHNRAQNAIIQWFCMWEVVISFPFEILRRINPTFTAICTPNAVYACFILETSPTVRKIHSFNDFACETLWSPSRLRYCDV